jgi:23S rRNA (uracil1939-C5)-methyltransferase
VRVRGVVPGERVAALPCPDDPPWGRVVERFDTSRWRRQPPCRLVDACGGCHWLHIDENLQRQLRRDAAIARLSAAGVPRAESLEPEMLPAPAPLGYRHRARFQVGPRGPDGAAAIGFHRPGSRRVLDVPECPLLAPELARAYAALRAALAEVGVPEDLTGIELTALPGAHGALAWINPRDRAPAPWPAWGRRLLEAADGAFAAVAVQPGRDTPAPLLLGESPVRGTTPAGRPVTAAPGTFVQANLASADRLVEAILTRAAPALDEPVLELCAGSGLLSWALAASGARVEAVESHPNAVAAAALLPKPPRGSVVLRREDAARALHRVRREGPAPSLVVANPPRAGLGEALAPLRELAPPRVVLACCSHAGFAKDSSALCRAGYRLTRPALVDMFPQTRHPELLALFCSE